MNRFDDFVSKLNFKKIIIVYLLISIFAGILSAGFLAYTFRDKLTFLYEYHRISEKVESNRNKFENMESELTNLANTSPDMVDVLILNGKNEILFSAKNSDLSKSGTLTLTPSSVGRGRFLTDQENPDAHFRLMKGDKLTLSMSMLGIENEVEQEYTDLYFYENGFNSKNIYLLSYITDRSSGEKVYFISDVQPVANGKFYIKAVAALAMLFFMLYWVLLALWVYAKALKSKMNPAMWGIITLFTNLAGLFVFLIYRQGHQICYKCGTLQNKSNVYCTFCGAKFGYVCKKCNTAADEKDRYCRHCGNKLDGERNQDE